ncbi:MAG: hypothetical protein WBP72_04225 [Rhodocyclaceae bacterium]
MLVAILAATSVRGQQLELTLASIEHPAISARQVQLRIDVGSNGSAELRIGALRVRERRFSQVLITCVPLRWTGDRLDCPGGRLEAARQKNPIPVALRLAPAAGDLQLSFEPALGERWRVSVSGRGEKRRVDLDVANGDIERSARWVPQMAGLRAKGKLDAKVGWIGPGSGREQIEGDLQLAGGAFSDQAGTHAADKLGVSAKVRAQYRAGQWLWETDAHWSRGEAFWAPWYLSDGGVRAKLAGTLSTDSLAITTGKVALREVGSADFAATVALPYGRVERAQFQTAAINLVRASPLFLAPVLEQAGVPQFDVSGQLQLGGEIAAGKLVAFDAKLAGVGITESRQRFALSGLSGPLAWRSDAQTSGVLRIGSAAFGKLQSGSFDIPYRASGLSFAMPKLAVPLLDGRVLAENLEAKQIDGRWSWQFGGAVEPISMERLTLALGLPRMAGTLSASIPGVRYVDSVLAMDGALVIQVFDGFLSATDLVLIEPLGRVPRLQATLEARHLHLGQLTDTFSFGSITGYVDAYLRNLELANWRPQRFDALVITSPGSFRKRISQRAVQNISALGGAGPVAALQRSVLGVFDEFGYDKLGLSCSLGGGVCEMGGVEPAPGGYVIVKGGGVPSITVIGYNRRVDWDELLARLQRVISSNAAPVVQ